MDPGVGALHGRDEELLFGGEELEQVGLRDPRQAGDLRRRRGVKPALGDHALGGRQHRLPANLGGR